MRYRIREIRKNLGMTQDELSEKSGISRATVWKLETGDEVTMTKTLLAIAKALGVSVSELFAEDA